MKKTSKHCQTEKKLQKDLKNTCKKQGDRVKYESCVEICRKIPLYTGRSQGDHHDSACAGRLPWDREQDHKSIRRDFLEECYEAIEAIDTEDPVLLREELGDVLFQVAFHSELEREAGRFDLDDVISDVAAKMVQRHPHVFADVTADTTEQVLTNWDQIKRETKKQKSDREVLESVTPAMPALMRTQKVLKKAAKMGADNGTTDDLRESVCKAVSGATRRKRRGIDWQSAFQFNGARTPSRRRCRAGAV